MKRTLVTFGKSDPLHLTEALHETGLEATYVWGPHFNRPKPEWASTPAWGYDSLYDAMADYDVVYTGHGATLLEATAAGCEVMVLTGVELGKRREEFPEFNTSGLFDTAVKVNFVPAWTRAHLDHSGRSVRWWEPGVMRAMADEIAARRGG